MLAQLTDNPKEVAKLYEKGVTVFLNELNTLSTLEEENKYEKINSIKSSIASGYSALAELYMTSILWYV